MNTMRPLVSRALLGLLVTCTIIASARAQDVRYKTKSKTELHVLGFLGGLFDGETEEEVSIKNYKMRADRKKESTITDLDGERIINIDHKKKEYSIITFDEMAEMMKSLGSQMKDAEKPEAPQGESPEYEVEFDLEVKDTGKTKEIDKHKATQKVLIIETRFKPKDASADTLPSGAMFAVTDLWLADGLSEMEAERAFRERMAEVMKDNMASMDMAGVTNQLLDSYPQVGAAMDRSKEELLKLEGTPLASTMHLVTVPADMELDLAQVLGEKKEEKKKGGGLGGFLKKMKESVQNAEQADAKPEQKTILSVYSTTYGISNKSRDASYFDPPSGYKEVEYESPMKNMEEH